MCHSFHSRDTNKPGATVGKGMVIGKDNCIEIIILKDDDRGGDKAWRQFKVQSHLNEMSTETIDGKIFTTLQFV